MENILAQVIQIVDWYEMKFQQNKFLQLDGRFDRH